jgi:hypothetical protein
MFSSPRKTPVQLISAVGWSCDMKIAQTPIDEERDDDEVDEGVEG